MKTLVLTGAVFPATPVMRADPEVRRLDYQTSLFLWLTQSPFERLIYADASGGDRVCNRELQATAVTAGKILEHAAYDLSAVATQHGKGRSEAVLLERVVSDFHLTDIYKVTGRLFVRNCHVLALQPAPVIFSALYDWNPSLLDTRFFRASAAFLAKQLFPATPEISDGCQSTWIESVYTRVATSLSEPWQDRPAYYGRNATNDREET